MTVAPELQPLLDVLAATAQEPGTLSPVELRALFEQMPTATAPDPIGAVTERTIPGPAGTLAVRVYRPDGDGPFPVVTYLHGGGWVIGSLDTHDSTCRILCRRSGAVVVSVDYRLAPEHPYPAAIDDATAALEWVASSAAEIDGDPARLAVAGDSAGGNLAAVAARRARDGGGPGLAAQVLIYPVIDCGLDTPSYRDNAADYFLTADQMRWFWEQYVPEPQRRAEPDASPLRADDLSGLPPALVLTAEYDPLRDEGERYAERLRDAGVPVRAVRYDSMIHGFYSMHDVTPRASEAQNLVAEFLQDAFAAR